MGDILITRFSSLGDLVTLEPMLRALRHFHADDTITFVTSTVGRELYAERFERVIVRDEKQPSHRLQVVDLLGKIGEHRFDFVYDLQGSSTSLLLAHRLNKRRLVNQTTRLWQKLIGYKARGRRTDEVLSAAGFTRGAIGAYLDDPANRTIRLEASETDREAFRRQLRERSGERPLAIIAPGASERWRSKHWGDGNYIALARGLNAGGFAVAVVGSRLEQAAAARIVEALPEAADFTGRTSVGQLKALVGEAALFVGNDSGPAHIAAGMGTATVTLFGPTAVKHCVGHYPYRGEHRCLTPHDVACHPCYKPECPTRHECMASISVHEVLDACLTLAGENRGRD